MKKLAILAYIIFLINIASAQENGIINNGGSPHVRFKSVDIGDCRWTEGFWADRLEIMHDAGVPNMWDLLSDPEIMHSKQNFLIAGGQAEGKHVGTNWLDGDTYKWLEGVAYVYAATGNEKLNQLMDEVIGYISIAQQPDGYINTQITIPGKKRFQSVQDHETYNMGHLMTAGCIHYRVTGKSTLLDIGKKAGDCLYETFMNSDKHFLGYSSIMGLVELYRTTGDKRYLDLADHFVSTQGTGDVQARRSSSWIGMGGPGRQDHKPLREETEAVGHSVRGNYFYCGATDVYAETGDTTLLEALERIWEDMTFRKMYITGGVSALYRGATRSRDVVWEAYGHEFQLNNATAYNETCANIGVGMWNWRLLNVTGNPRHADILERVIYNSALSPISLDGKHFFYTNPLRRVDGIPLSHRYDAERWTHQMGFCCPPNVIRTLPKVSGWAYSLVGNGIAVNLYGGNELATSMLDGSEIKLTQETRYPWEGRIEISIQKCKKESFQLLLRIPEWADGSTLLVNGKDPGVKLNPGTYAKIERKWKKGDVILLDLPMDIKLIEGHSFVEEVRNEAAVTRGPIVYCLESEDLPEGTEILDVYLPAGSEMSAEFRPELLGGVTTITGSVLIRQDHEEGLYHELGKPEWKPTTATFVPYYAWSNRGQGEMTVFLPLVWK
ncbi:glycoside hydrolase family 127 protein [Bacteroidota bacterium]